VKLVTVREMYVSFGPMVRLDHCQETPDRGPMAFFRIYRWTFCAHTGAHGALRLKAMV